jgi:hypothetical protein
VERYCYESPTIKDLFKHSTKDEPPTMMEDSRLSTVVEAYRQKMTASHRALFSGRIKHLENDRSLTDKQRLDLISPYFRAQRWGTKGHGGSVTSLSQLLIPPGQQGYIELGVNHDGTVPPSAEDQREEFLQELQSLIGERFDGLKLPEEYIELLTLTDAISDLDFIYSRTAGLNGVCGGIPSGLQIVYDLSQWEDRGWTVLGGWQCGIGDMSETQLLICRNTGSCVQDERDLRWRVYHFDREDHDGRFYGSIACWLNWRAGWFDRLPSGWETVNPPLLLEDVEYGVIDDEEEDEDEEVEEEDEYEVR